MVRNRIPYLLAALAAAAAVGPGSAGAADDVKPTPCTGLFVTDPAGDQIQDPFPGVNVVPAMAAAESSLDIREVFFTTRPNAEGKLQLTAHMVIANLSKDVPANAHAGETSYMVRFATTDSNVLWLTARNADGEISYGFGYYPDTELGEGTGILTEGETTGSWIDGEMGVVSVDMPADRTLPGMVLKDAYARTSTTTYEEEFAVGTNTADTAPNDGAAAKKSHTATECPAAEPTVDPVVDPEPVVAPVTTQTAAPAAAPAPTTATTAPTTAKKKKVTRRAKCLKKAKKIKNKRKRAKAVKRCKKRFKKR